MNIEFIGMACALGLSAMGSAFGSGFAAQASVGAWKKCYANGKPAPFIMVAFSGAPLTQTIYGFLLMNFIRSAVASGADPALAMFTGIFAGLAIGLSAFFQGKVAAASADADDRRLDVADQAVSEDVLHLAGRGPCGPRREHRSRVRQGALRGRAALAAGLERPPLGVEPRHHARGATG